MMEIYWTCPRCGEINLDDIIETTFPFCERCGTEFIWDDITTIEQIDAANRIIDLYAKAKKPSGSTS